eukprot:g5183.t1
MSEADDAEQPLLAEEDPQRLEADKSAAAPDASAGPAAPKPSDALFKLKPPDADAAARTMSTDSDRAWRKPAVLKKYHWLILMSLNTIGPFSSDAYVPNLSTIASELNASNQLVSFTIQINWIVLGLFNPVLGALSDKHGRKTVITAALVVYILGALGSAFSRNIAELIAARCVQGAGEAVSIVTSAVIRDVVDDMNERQRLQAFFAMLRPLMIMGAPVVGGGLASAFGWRRLFYVLAAWGLLTLLLVNSCIPESNKEELFRNSERQRRAAAAAAAAAGGGKSCLPAALQCLDPRSPRSPRYAAVARGDDKSGASSHGRASDV